MNTSTPNTIDQATRRLPQAATQMPVVFAAVCAAAIAALDLWGGFFPSGKNWGFHQLAFLPLPLKLLIPAAMPAVLLPSVQGFILRSLKLLAGFLQRRKRGQRILFGALLSLAGIALFWLGRERTFFLGDGHVVIRDLPNIAIAEGIPLGFKNEPLAGAVIWNLYRLLTWLGAPLTGEFAYQIASIVFGLGSIILVLFIVRQITEEFAERVLLGVFLLAGGGSQLFFGYVENYAPLYFGLLLFILLGIGFLRGKVHPVAPSIAFGALFTLQFGMIALLPAFLWLLAMPVRKGRPLAALLSLLAMGGTVAAILYFCCFTPELLSKIFLKGENHLVPLAAASGITQAYSFFNLSHLLDLANLQLLVSPFAIAMLAFVLLARRKQKRPLNTEWMFILLIALCGLAFTAIFNCEIGMSRDWDLMSSYAFGIALLAGYASAYFIESRNVKQRVLVVMCAVTLLHTAAFVAVNAGEERSTQRFVQLRDESLWSKQALTYADEEIGAYYYKREEHSRALEFYRHYLSLDSTNSRIWLSTGMAYEKMGQADTALGCYRRSADLGSKEIFVFLSLAQYYGNAGKYPESRAMLEKALAIDSTSAQANRMMGILISVEYRNYAQALPFFLRSIQSDPSHPDSYLNAGICYSELKQPGPMKTYWEKYLELSPGGEHAEEIRKMIGGK